MFKYKDLIGFIYIFPELYLDIICYNHSHLYIQLLLNIIISRKWMTTLSGLLPICQPQYFMPIRVSTFLLSIAYDHEVNDCHILFDMMILSVA